MADPTPADRGHVKPVPLRHPPGWEPSALHLPASLTSFVGREREVAAVADLLRRSDARLVTLTGPGGVGKTRLALAIAHTVAPSFADGAVFVDLAPIRDPALVLPAVARAVGVREVGEPLLADRLTAVLRGRDLLLVLDNFEQVIAAAPVLAELLGFCPRVKALVTSRVVLRVSGEHRFPVGPLALPDSSTVPQVDRLADAAALRLFAERARASDPGFALTPENAAAVAGICHRLDGLPLAIELAAARTRHLPPAVLLPRLAHGLPLLTGGPRDAPARQRTMRDAIAWSHDLLPPTEQALFRRLAVFVGEFSLAAAEAVCAAGGGLDVDPLDGVASLIDASLVRRLEPIGGEARFAMLETLREFGFGLLADHREEPSVRDAHAGFCLVLAEAGEPALVGPDQGAWLDRFTAEHGNFQAAIAWLAERGRVDEGLRLGAALGWFWYVRGHYAIGRAALARLLALPGAADAAARTGAEIAAARLAIGPGDGAHEIGLLEDAVVRLRASGEAGHAFLTTALATLAEAVVQRGDPARATALVQESLLLARARHDRWDEAWCLNLLGVTSYGQDDLAGAGSRFDEVLRLLRDLGDPRFLAVTLGNAGWVAAARGDTDRAAACYREQVPLARSVGDPYLLVWGLDGVAAIAVQRGQDAPAARLLGAAAAIRAAAGDAVPGVAAARRDRYVNRARTRLGDDGFAAAWQAGQALSALDAVAEALAVLAVPSVPAPSPVMPHGLTPREAEILDLLARRWTDKEIAAALFVSPRTVTSHVTGILTKLGVGSRREAAAVAVRDGLV